MPTYIARCAICRTVHENTELKTDRVLKSVKVCQKCRGKCVGCGADINSDQTRLFCKGCLGAAKGFAGQEVHVPEFDYDDVGDHCLHRPKSPITHQFYDLHGDRDRFDGESGPDDVFIGNIIENIEMPDQGTHPEDVIEEGEEPGNQ